jgi:hypothetical protein
MKKIKIAIKLVILVVVFLCTGKYVVANIL